MAKIECPACDGEGGGTDHFGEGWDCLCCRGEGECLPERHAEYLAEIAAVDARIAEWLAEVERGMCAACGVDRNQPGGCMCDRAANTGI